MNKAILLFFVCAIIGTGLLAGGAGLLVGNGSGWGPENYKTVDGECWVRPQGDPLYDAHYAKDVNLPNCEALTLQEQAQQVEAVTRKIDWETEGAKMGVFSLLFVVCSILALLVVAVVRGNNGAT